jgi:hypothetical protein
LDIRLPRNRRGRERKSSFGRIRKASPEKAILELLDEADSEPKIEQGVTNMCAMLLGAMDAWELRLRSGCSPGRHTVRRRPQVYD